MANAMWPLSRTREYDVNGDPVIGAQAFFYEVGTTTPQSIYTDADLSIAHDQPVLTDGTGRWPAVYLNSDPGEYRQRVLDDEDAVLFDDDEISVPLSATFTPPEAGDTSEELLARTGDLSFKYRTGAVSGWVRSNGLSIGSASSGATERANADTEDLFTLLWNQDSSLSVSGGRGANAAADWAANKTIALPDLRHRLLAGLGDMGNSNAGRIATSLLDGGDTNITLGGIGGADDVTLSTSQLPAHNHNVNPPNTTTSTDGAHTHGVPLVIDFGDTNEVLVGAGAGAGTASTTSGGSHSHDINIAAFDSSNTGGGNAHTNLQPTMLVTAYIKL